MYSLHFWGFQRLIRERLPSHWFVRSVAEDSLRQMLETHNTQEFSKPVTASVMEARDQGFMYWGDCSDERKMEGLAAFQGK